MCVDGSADVIIPIERNVTRLDKQKFPGAELELSEDESVRLTCVRMSFWRPLSSLTKSSIVATIALAAPATQ